MKELEKFGFKFNDTTGEWYFFERNLNGKTYIKINSWNRKFKVKIEYDYDNLVLQVLYNLIKINLVEKMED